MQPVVAGPKRPQDKVLLAGVPDNFIKNYKIDSSVPFFGESIVQWLWGGFSVGSSNNWGPRKMQNGTPDAFRKAILGMDELSEEDKLTVHRANFLGRVLYTDYVYIFQLCGGDF